MNDALVGAVIIAVAIVYAAHALSRQPRRTTDGSSFREEFLYGNTSLMSERIAVAMMAGRLIGDRMVDPKYHEEIERYNAALLDHKTRDRAETLLSETDVFAAPTQDKFARAAWAVYDHVTHLQSERLRGWYSKPIDLDDLRERSSS